MPSEQNEIRDDCSQPATTYRTLIRLLVLEGWTAKILEKKQLVRLWLSLHPEDSYLNHCMKTAKTLQDVPEHMPGKLIIGRFWPYWRIWKPARMKSRACSR